MSHARTWKDNAAEFAALDRGEGWQFAILVACSVEKGADNGRPKTSAIAEVSNAKVSAAEFARAAGCSDTRVGRYLDAWQETAGRGWVQDASSLTPDMAHDLTVPDCGVVSATEALFPLAAGDIAVTSDDCYTPRWIFDAMGLRFDLDVAAPVGGPWHVPCKRYYTAQDDGLTSPWDGLVWCNPPYSDYWSWAHRWLGHGTGVLMGIVLPETAWLPPIFAAADCVAFCAPEFARPDTDRPIRLRQKVFVAFRGVGTEPAERLAAADPYGAVLYGRPAA